jgi:hypothetical protein
MTYWHWHGSNAADQSYIGSNGALCVDLDLLLLFAAFPKQISR